MGSALSWLALPSLSAVPKLYTVSTPVRLKVKNVDKLGVKDEVSLSSFLQTRCPSLFAPYTPAWWLNNGHLQTAYCVFGDFSKVDKVVYDRTLLRLKDGGTIGIDSTPPANERSIPDDAPIVVVMHGLTGGSHESYVRAVLHQATKPREDGGLGYRGIVVNFRGCAGVPITSGQLYSAGHTDDLRQAVVYISQKYPNAPLLGLGFSLGANVMIRYLSEEGDKCRLRAACGLGCPWDLVLNSSRLEENFFLRNIYSKGMGSNLVNVMKRNEQYVEKLPENRISPILPELFAIKSPTLFDVDSLLTRNVGGSSPPFPFPTAKAYYEWASSHHCLGEIRVPLLAVNAVDDPIVRHVPYDVGDNGYVALVVTEGGGHLGWFEAAGERGTVRRWVTGPVIEWLKAIGDDYEPAPMAVPEVETEGEWTLPVNRKDLGYKVLGDAGQIEGVEGEGGLFAGL